MSTSSSAQPDHHSHGDAKHRRRPQLDHLNVEVPTVAAANGGWFTGCFRPSPTSSSSPSSHGQVQGHNDRPASPSLIRSPTAWIKAKGHSFGSGKHTRRRSRDFHYNALSYARNFDDGGTDSEAEEETGLAASDALKHRGFAFRLPTSPPHVAGSPSGSGLATGGGHGKSPSVEPARHTGRDLE